MAGSIGAHQSSVDNSLGGSIWRVKEHYESSASALLERVAISDELRAKWSIPDTMSDFSKGCLDALSKLEKREGVQYVKGETEPFTGTEIANYEDNSKWETPYKDGKMHGMQIVYRDEVLYEKRSYIDGKRDGSWIKYDPETGRKTFETLYKNGKRSLRYEYNRYGNLEQKELYENGKRSLRMKWDRSGKLVEKETF